MGCLFKITPPCSLGTRMQDAGMRSASPRDIIWSQKVRKASICQSPHPIIWSCYSCKMSYFLCMCLSVCVCVFVCMSVILPVSFSNASISQ